LKAEAFIDVTFPSAGFLRIFLGLDGGNR